MINGGIYRLLLLKEIRSFLGIIKLNPASTLFFKDFAFRQPNYFLLFLVSFLSAKWLFVLMAQSEELMDYNLTPLISIHFQLFVAWESILKCTDIKPVLIFCEYGWREICIDISLLLVEISGWPLD